MLCGLSIHADEVVAPLPLVFHASQSQFSQIQESMREMVVTQNDVSEVDLLFLRFSKAKPFMFTSLLYNYMEMLLNFAF